MPVSSSACFADFCDFYGFFLPITRPLAPSFLLYLRQRRSEKHRGEAERPLRSPSSEAVCPDYNTYPYCTGTRLSARWLISPPPARPSPRLGLVISLRQGSPSAALGTGREGLRQCGRGPAPANRSAAAPHGWRRDRRLKRALLGTGGPVAGRRRRNQGKPQARKFRAAPSPFHKVGCFRRFRGLILRNCRE